MENYSNKIYEYNVIFSRKGCAERRNTIQGKLEYMEQADDDHIFRFS